MKINVKFTICLLLALIICSGATYLTNRAVVKKRIQQITKQKLENITNSVLHFIEKEETSMENLEKIINKEINIGKTGFMAIIDTKGNMLYIERYRAKTG